MPESKPLVLITGATGHIGFATLLALLRASYSARITSRSASSLTTLLSHPLLTPYSTSITTLTIPDPLAPHAYDDAVRDVTFILHLASPIPDPTLIGNPKKHYIDPAVRGTIAMLEAAATSKTVKRIVVTSSVVVLAAKTPGATIGPDDFAPIPNSDDLPDDLDPSLAYRASKTIAHHVSMRWMRENNPAFDLVYVLPAYVQGRNWLVVRKEDVRNGSNGVMIDLVVMGKRDEKARFANTVLVDDVAEVEVKALDMERVKGGDCLIASPGRGIRWDDVTELVGRMFPGEVERGMLNLGGRQVSLTVDYDVSYAERVTGVKFRGLEEQVKSLIGQYVELAEKEANIEASRSGEAER